MTEKVKKDNKNLIIGVCAAIVAIVIIIVVIFATKGGTPKIDDSYFVSDGTKYVLTTESDEYEYEDDEYAPVKTHLVYNYSGDKITGMTTYFEYGDEASAKAAYEFYKSSDDQEGAKSITLNGKYVVIEMTEENYEGVTASDVKEQIEFMEMLQNMDLDDLDDEE